MWGGVVRGFGGGWGWGSGEFVKLALKACFGRYLGEGNKRRTDEMSCEKRADSATR